MKLIRPQNVKQQVASRQYRQTRSMRLQDKFPVFLFTNAPSHQVYNAIDVRLRSVINVKYFYIRNVLHT